MQQGEFVRCDDQHRDWPTTISRVGRIAGTSTALIAALALAGCGHGGGGEDANAARYLGEILSGHSPGTVISRVKRVAPSALRAVRDKADAAKEAGEEFAEDPEPACKTLDAINRDGGVDKVSPEQILQYAKQNFSRTGAAEMAVETFANDLSELSNGDLAHAPITVCHGYDVREAFS
jgi:hypothetical protein